MPDYKQSSFFSFSLHHLNHGNCVADREELKKEDNNMRDQVCNFWVVELFESHQLFDITHK